MAATHETSLLKIKDSGTYKKFYNVTIAKGTFLVATEDRECQICADETKDEEVLLQHKGKCSFLSHADCGLEWLKAHATCPNCRAILDPLRTKGEITPEIEEGILGRLDYIVDRVLGIQADLGNDTASINEVVDMIAAIRLRRRDADRPAVEGDSA